jgi:hypothetical protein
MIGPTFGGEPMFFGGIHSFANDGQGHPSRWRRPVRASLAAYVAIGFVLACVINIKGLLVGAPTAFSFGGSLQGMALLWFWWFFVPALIWPALVWWTIYHWLLS